MEISEQLKAQLRALPKPTTPQSAEVLMSILREMIQPENRDRTQEALVAFGAFMKEQKIVNVILIPMIAAIIHRLVATAPDPDAAAEALRTVFTVATILPKATEGDLVLQGRETVN